MYSTSDLVILAKVYLEAIGIAESTLSTHAFGNDKSLGRLAQGCDCTTRSAARASDWFDRHWPPGLAWPQEVRRRASLGAVGPAPVSASRKPAPAPAFARGERGEGAVAATAGKPAPGGERGEGAPVRQRRPPSAPPSAPFGGPAAAIPRRRPLFGRLLGRVLPRPGGER